MVRAGAPTPNKRKEKDAAAAAAAAAAASTAEDKAEELENRRLRDLAFSHGLLSRTKAQANNPLRPSKSILNCDGRDIVKKGHRKSKYLFSFPGLMAPVAGGKIGELTNLDSKNPVLYVDFPQGRLKLFGTIVYPKNKYMTLHFVRGSGSIICEDCFESLVVFSVAWWIGTKEENPKEARLPFPKNLEQDKHSEFDFTAGAGQSKSSTAGGEHKDKSEPVSLSKLKAKVEASQCTVEEPEAQASSQPVRQSARTAGRKLKYVDEASSSEENEENSSDDFDTLDHKEVQSDVEKKQVRTMKESFTATKAGDNAPISLDSDGDTPVKVVDNTMHQRQLSPELEIVRTESSKQSRPPSAKRIAVLKQSKLEAFSQKEEHTTMVHEASSLKTVNKEGSKSTGKPLKPLHKSTTENSDPKDFDNDANAENDTPSKGRKRVKNAQAVNANQGSAKRPKVSHPKTKVIGDDDSIESEEKTKNQSTSGKGKKRVTGTTPQRGAALKGKKTTRTKGSRAKLSDVDGTEDELSVSAEVSDDSDEDWVG